MGVFRPKQHECELNFNDEYIYNLPLHEDTADAIDKAVNRLKTIAPKDRPDIDKAYNEALEVIDGILGEGAADEIMSLYTNPGTLEVWDVIYYILAEWGAAYNEHFERIKATAQLPNAPRNRAERRGAR